MIHRLAPPSVPFLPRAVAAAALVATLVAGGCATMQPPKWPWAATAPGEAEPDDAAGDGQDDADVISSDDMGGGQDFGFEYFKGENVRKRWMKMTGRGPNEQVAREAMAEADALFKGGDYKGAMPKYQTVIDRWPDTALEEDARWQLAECLFFTDQYPKAEDAYDELVKKFANTKYLDRIAHRQFVIAQYWIALDEKHHYPTIVPNVMDRSRPLFDTRGRAMKAFDHVRINDPRGTLADDSLMAQANAHFLEHEWLDADYFYGLLRSEYPDSDFLLQAHLLGLQSKLHAYQGAGYEGGILDEAEILADQVLVQFPDQLAGEEEARVEKTRVEIAARQAERHRERAEFYEKGRHYTAARMYYALITRDFHRFQEALALDAERRKKSPVEKEMEKEKYKTYETYKTLVDLAQAARDRYTQIADCKDVSDDPFPMLTRVLNPDSLKEAELDAMAEAEEQAAIARGPAGDEPPRY